MVVRMENVGGAVVKRGFRRGAEYLHAGANLSAEELAKIPPVNRTSLVNTGRLDLYPMPPGTRKHVVSAGFGRFNVIEGRLLNQEPLTKEQAVALAGAPDEPLPGEEKPAEQAPIGDPPAAPTPKQTRAKARKKRVKATPPRN